MKYGDLRVVIFVSQLTTACTAVSHQKDVAIFVALFFMDVVIFLAQTDDVLILNPAYKTDWLSGFPTRRNSYK